MTSPTLLELAERWEAEAQVLERNADPRGAELLRLHASDLRAAVEDAGKELLTLAEASEASGYSLDHLRHEIAKGRIPNAGEKGRPRIRRGDLPMKPGAGRKLGTGLDAATAAREILASVGGAR